MQEVLCVCSGRGHGRIRLFLQKGTKCVIFPVRVSGCHML